MSEIRNTGDFARVQKIKNDSGDVERIQAYVTSDILLKKGQTFYLNPLDESYALKVKNNIIDQAKADEALGSIKANDEQFNRETSHVCRAVETKKKG